MPKIRIIKLKGVKIEKYIKAITIGAIILPNSSPNLIHALFNGLSNFFLKRANDKKIMDADKAQYLIVFPPEGKAKQILKGKQRKIEFQSFFLRTYSLATIYSLQFAMQLVFKQLLVNYICLLYHLKNSKDI